METLLIKALQLILSLSILVLVHELGHFLFARLFKIRVEKFYLFFDAGFALLRFKPKNSHTEYGIGWLPLGGYCKISGMIDESMDMEQMKTEPKPWEFRSKPAWQRLLVMLGGVLFNFILAIFILSMMVFVWGDTYIPYKNFKDGMTFSENVKKAGFRDGDILVSADGRELRLYDGIMSANSMMDFFDAEQVQVERDGQMVNIVLPENFIDNILDKANPPFAFKWQEGLFPVMVDSVSADSEAGRIGLQRGDSIVAVNDSATITYLDFRNTVMNYRGDTISLVYYRAGVSDTVSAVLDTNAVLGFSLPSPEYVVDKYGFFASFPVGIEKGINTLRGYISQSKLIFSKEGVKNLGGFGTMGSMFSPTWNWESFWSMTAFLSIVLAFMNILPIPLLDGGHIMFLLYEMITRRKPNEKFQEYATWIGIFLILGLLIVANGNDIIRAIFGDW
ncbi:RIP metalloprotease RseP [Dysgonomonas sp. 25]|uniref:RIP metalloprotease RseP n=1 Tax=Dysgonomonas sp. 25 TaxID=2302933 RepID=UPI0013D06BE2|nr:RIP metalloprotease RseP [Dysgonomonas sp. 25]NDV68763.1 RIP metalloprotease RseP [Dysgonomonas sp. 25]